MPPAVPSLVAAVTGPVYHYTDGGGLLGITTNGMLRASEASGLNDRAEVRQGWKRIRRILKKVAKSDAVDLLRTHAKLPLKRSHEVFVLCASTRGDDANQWRSYARGGTGYAVELDASTPLTVVTEAPIITPTTSRVSLAAAGDLVDVSPWLHVIYREADIKAALNSLEQSITLEAASITASTTATADEKQDEMEDLANRAYDDLARIAHLIKEPGFAGENEVRVVATFFYAARHIKYRSGAYGVVGYAELATRPSTHPAFRVMERKSPTLPLNLQSVRIGPLLDKNHKESVRGLLRSRGLQNVTVKRSKTPLR